MSFRMRKGRASFSVGRRGPRTSYRMGCLLPIAVGLTLLAGGCTAGGSESPADVGTPLPFVAEPTETPEPEPTAAPAPKALSVKVTKRTASVRRNGTASVTIKTGKGARCSINVEYASGSATAAGLIDKKANASGVVTWSWKVGGRTTTGRWPIDITCDLGSRSGHVSTSFVVR